MFLKLRILSVMTFGEYIPAHVIYARIKGKRFDKVVVAIDELGRNQYLRTDDECNISLYSLSSKSLYIKKFKKELFASLGIVSSILAAIFTAITLLLA